LMVPGGSIGLESSLWRRAGKSSSSSLKSSPSLVTALMVQMMVSKVKLRRISFTRSLHPRQRSRRAAPHPGGSIGLESSLWRRAGKSSSSSLKSSPSLVAPVDPSADSSDHSSDGADDGIKSEAEEDILYKEFAPKEQAQLTSRMICEERT
jgi:hypothetical protein